jgi:hypothetical protein
MVPGSLPNPISFDQYYYCCFLRDGDRKSSVDGETDVVAPTDVCGDSDVAKYVPATVPVFEATNRPRWDVIGYDILRLVFHFVGGLIQRPFALFQKPASGMKN